MFRSVWNAFSCQQTENKTTDMEMDKLPDQRQQAHIYNLYTEMRKKNWKKIVRLVKEDSQLADDIFFPYSGGSPEKTYNVLHCAIKEINDAEKAAEIVEDIFDKALFLPFTGNFEETLFNFTNFVNDEGKTPLDIALERKYYKVVEILLDYSADVTLGTQCILNEEYQKLVLKKYDRGLKLEGNPCNIQDERWWSLRYDFRKMIGTPSPNDPPNDKYQETKLLATTLRLPRERRTEIMLHPLVQIFVGEKYKKYNGLISLSILYHIIWSVMSATYIMCVNTVVTKKNSSFPSANASYVEPNVENVCAALKLKDVDEFRFPNYGIFGWTLFCFFVVSLIKEVYECLRCPSRKYYFNQFENIGQWTTILVLFLSLFPTRQIIRIPFCSFLVVSLLIEIYRIWKRRSKRRYFQHFRRVDKWIIVGTTFAVYFIPSFSTWKWMTSMGIYVFVPIISLAIFLLLAIPVCCIPLAKNIFQKFFTNDKIKYWWNQLNVFFQWIAISIQLELISEVPMEQPWTNIVFSLVCSVGIASSLFLIQGQLTKTESFGVYNQMMMKGFKILISFLATFFPILAAYFVIFILLMPSNRNFKISDGIGLGKIVAMLTGDLGFDDLFSEENIILIPYVISANIAVIFFAITVVLLLQNLLIGLTVNDLQKLRRKATAAHVANRLEVIYLMERFLMSGWILWLLNLVNLHVVVIQWLSVTNHSTLNSSNQVNRRADQDTEAAQNLNDEDDSLLAANRETSNLELNEHVADQNNRVAETTVDELDDNTSSQIHQPLNFGEFPSTIQFMRLHKSVKEIILENSSHYLK